MAEGLSRYCWGTLCQALGAVVKDDARDLQMHVHDSQGCCWCKGKKAGVLRLNRKKLGTNGFACKIPSATCPLPPVNHQLAAGRSSAAACQLEQSLTSTLMDDQPDDIMVS